MTKSADDRSWERGWEGHSRAQLERLARLPLSEKLAWLEEAQRLSKHLRRGTSDRTPPNEE